MRAEFEGPWTAYQQQAGAHEGWQTAAVYIRESRKEQVDGFSPVAQLKGTLEEAVRRRLWVPCEHIFLDLMSGRREDRVEFQNLLVLARTGVLAAVLVLHSSRWARNAMVSRKYKEELRRRGIQVIATNAPFDVATPQGKFAERVSELVDELQSDTIGWWVSVGLREKAARGEPLGRLPETFCRDEAGRIIPHPELSPIVLEGARRYATGRYGFGELARWCEREGLHTPKGRPLTDEWWRNALGNPTNTGLVAYHRKRRGKEMVQAAFPGFIPLDLFQRVQETRRQRVRLPKQGSRYRVYLLSGLARCATCGAQVTAVEDKRMRCRRSAQHARCREPSAKAEALERQIGEWVTSAFALPPALKARVAALVRAKVESLTPAQSVERAGSIRQRMKRVTDAYTWGALDESEYRAQLLELKAQLEKAEAVPDERRMMAAIRVAQDFAAAWARARPERRKQLLGELFEVVRVAEGRIVSVKPKADVLPLVAVTAAGLQGKDWRSRPDSNRRSRP